MAKDVTATADATCSLREMQHEFVVAVELILFDPHDLAAIVYADDQITPFGVEESCDRLNDCMCNLRRVFAILFQIPAQRRVLPVPVISPERRSSFNAYD